MVDLNKVKSDLESSGKLTPTNPSDILSRTASKLAASGQIKPRNLSLDEVSKNLPAFMNEAPVEEEHDGILERGWDVAKRIASFGGHTLWKSLGIIAWPLERIEYTIATAPTTIAREKPFRKMFVEGEGTAKEAATKVWKAQVEALKTWIPGRPVPESVKSFSDMYGSYYEELAGEPAPDWYKWTMGGISSFVVAPGIQSKLLKTAVKPIAKPIKELAETLSPQWWRRAKLTRRAGISERVETAEELGKSLAKKDLEEIAAKLSEQTGTTITPKVVQERIRQIIQGGITKEPILQEKANAVVDEFNRLLAEQRKLGIIKGKVYTEKLTKKEIAKLNLHKADLEKQLTKLSPMVVKWTDEQKQVLALGKNAPVNIYRGAQSGKLYLDESKTIIQQIKEDVPIVTGTNDKVLKTLDNLPDEQVITLYHGTSINNATKILETKQLKPDDLLSVGFSTTVKEAEPYAAMKGGETGVILKVRLSRSELGRDIGNIKGERSPTGRYMTGEVGGSGKNQILINQVGKGKNWEVRVENVEVLGNTQVVAKDTGEILALDIALSDLSGQVRKGTILTAPYQEQLVKLAGKLKVSGKESIAKDLLELGEKIETGDLSYIEKLGNLLNINKKVVSNLFSNMVKTLDKAGAGIATTVDKALSFRQKEGRTLVNKILKLAGKEEKQKITGFLPLIKKIINAPKGMTSREYANRESLLKLADKLKISNKEGVIDDLLKLGDAIDNGDLKYIEKFGRMLNVSDKELFNLSTQVADRLVVAEKELGKPAENILRLREREGQKLVNTLLNIAAKTEKQKVKGLKPILNRIFTMKYRFPGKQKLIDNIQSKISDINQTLYTNEIFGGTNYFPRMYKTKELEKAKPFFVRAAKAFAIRAGYAKRREALPAEVRKQMQEITTAEYPVVKRLIQEGADIETAKLFQSVVEQPGMSSRIGLPGMKMLPNDDKYGALKGMFVHPKIYNDVMEMGRIKGNVEKVYDEAISLWKLFKVSWSPGAHFRNKFGNAILKDLSGMTVEDKVKYGYQAFRHVKQNSTEFLEAKKYFAHTTFSSEDLLNTLKDVKDINTATSLLGKGYKGFRKVVEKPAEWYRALEFHDKFSMFLKARSEGKSVIEAVEHANKWLFDYSDLATWEKNIMRRIMPFYTFPRKALPRVAEAAVNNPYALYKYPMMAQTATQVSLAKLDLSNEDYEKLKKIMPKYMKQGSYILMPYRDDNGDLRFFDWTYIIPWGEMVDVTDRGLINILVSNPLFTMVSDIQHNKSSFTGKEIWKKTDTTEEKTWAATEYIWQGLVPSLSFKGIYWDKLYRAATGETRYGKKEMIPEVIAHTVFGLRTQALDEKIAQRKNIYETQSNLREMQSKMISLIQAQNNGEITESEAIKLRQQYLQQMQGFIGELK